jgi:hypothetical protein
LISKTYYTNDVLGLQFDIRRKKKQSLKPDADSS